MNFAEQPPSKQWVPLKYRGETVAEVWFKPEGEPFGLTFRVPPKSFHIPGAEQRLTADNLLKAVGIAADEVESWRRGGASDSGMSGAGPELRQPPPPPPPDATHLTVHVRVKPPQGTAPEEGEGPEVGAEKWQELEARWNAILGLEVTIDTLRQRLESLLVEMEAASKKMLTADEKVHAFNADVAQWNKAKTRVHYAVPKVREYIHRATWATATPERKRLEEIFKDHAQPQAPAPEVEKLPDQLEHLLKDRQVLSAQGVTVCQECATIAADIQGTLRTLQSNAAANARKKLAEARKKGKFI